MEHQPKALEAKEAYNIWAEQYDTNDNKTRDLEGIALKEMLSGIDFESCLEIGCGTGKNTEWLLSKAKKLVAVDLSEEMLKKAKNKLNNKNVVFHLADIRKVWNFASEKFDLVTFSLVLEHLENLDSIFQKAQSALASKGFLYLGELHPFKQYTGTKARFNTEEGVQIVDCYNHHLSDFSNAAKKNGFEIKAINEFFDDSEKTNLPRILTILFQKSI